MRPGELALAGCKRLMRLGWLYLLGLGVVLWGLCGTVMAAGRRMWSLDTTLRVHLAAAPFIAFAVSAIHKLLAGDFNPVLRAMVLTGLVIVLDAAVVAPFLERSYAMFRTFIGTWIPFAAIFLASLLAGFVV